MGNFMTQYGDHPAVKQLAQLRDNSLVRGVTASGSKIRDTAAAVRERWQLSDSPLVHRLQDVGDRFMSESPEGRVLREIWRRDPGFDMNVFLQAVKVEAEEVVGAYLRGDAEKLAVHCTPEVTKRLLAIASALRSEGKVPDDRILFVGRPVT